MATSQMEAAWLKERPIAHRGLHDLSKGIPENSLAAFEHASKHGFPVEMDAQLTGDGTVVILHDINLSRMTGRDEAVIAADYKDISKLRLHGTDQQVPTFDEVLALINGKIPIVVEVKNFGKAGVLEDRVIELLRKRDQEAAIVSFNPRSLKYFRENAPEFPRGQNSGLYRSADLAGAGGVQLNWATKWLLRLMLLNAISRPQFVSYQREGITSLPVTVCRRLGMPILTWTVRSPSEEQSVRRYADNIFFEGFIPKSAVANAY